MDDRTEKLTVEPEPAAKRQDPTPAARPRKGYINAHFVNGMALTIITICIIIGVTASILAIWEYAERDTLLRTIATVGVITLGTALFASVNRMLGDD